MPPIPEEQTAQIPAADPSAPASIENDDVQGDAGGEEAGEQAEDGATEAQDGEDGAGEAEGAGEPVEAAEGEATAADDDAKPKRTPEQRRIARLTKEKAEAAREAQASKDRIAALEAIVAAQQRGDGEEDPANPTPKLYTEAEALALADSRASVIAQTNAQTTAINTVYDKAAAKLPTFEAAVATMREDLGADAIAKNGAVFLAITEFDNADDLLIELVSDPDTLAEIFDLTPIQQGARLAKISERLAKPKPVKLSEAPAPIVPLETRTVSEPSLQKLAESGDMAAYAARREKEVAERPRKW